MEVIYKKSGEGKTTELIKRCAENGGYIVSATQARAMFVFQFAKSLGYNIPFPITFDELMHGRYLGKGVRKIYIDDALELIQAIAKGLEVEAVAINDLPEEIKKTKQEKLKLKRTISGKMASSQIKRLTKIGRNG